MWKKIALQASFMALDYGLKQRKKKKSASKKRSTAKKTTKRGK